jgi:ATP-dependent Clp protease adaptor protein ClpS
MMLLPRRTRAEARCSRANCVQKLFGYPKEKADRLMLQVHTEGRAVVANGPRETCEMHVFRLHEHGLWATMQHDR